jgi:hypothetical protein
MLPGLPARPEISEVVHPLSNPSIRADLIAFLIFFGSIDLPNYGIISEGGKNKLCTVSE